MLRIHKHYLLFLGHFRERRNIKNEINYLLRINFKKFNCICMYVFTNKHVVISDAIKNRKKKKK